jgi:hypothetical protein
VIVLGAVDDAPRDALIVTEELLDLSDALAIGVIVAGTGELAVQGQHAALTWIEDHQEILMSRALRLAWVIEDARIRACTDTWLRCMGQTLFTVQSVTFRTLQTALPWLIETPWPIGPATEWRDRAERRAQASAPSKQRTVRLLSRS